MRLLFVNPPLKVDVKDTLTTGIVYMPFMLAYAAAICNAFNYEYEVLDLFGNDPLKSYRDGDSIVVGTDINSELSQINLNSFDVVVLFANQIINHSIIKALLKDVRKRFRGKIFILENSNAVTAYAVRYVRHELDVCGADDYIEGNLYSSFPAILNKHFNTNFEEIIVYIGKGISGPINIEFNTIMPDWTKFPLSNYWKHRLSHGPMSTDKYLPLLTSHGCPYPCKFCVMPSLSSRKWHYLPPSSVFEEMVKYYEKYNVSEFHIEDTNPTVISGRFEDLARLIIFSKYNRKFIWKFVSGTKLETFKSKESLQLLFDGGLRYVSFSPESGSEKIRKAIGKGFDIDHSKKFIKWAREIGVSTQACFVLGFADESWHDRLKTAILIIKYTILGIDEIAVFIITPVPGSHLYETNEFAPQDNDNFSFSPSWRSDYFYLFFTRILYYIIFLVMKFIFHPFRFFKNCYKIFFGIKSHDLKMEAAPLRSKHYKGLLK